MEEQKELQRIELKPYRSDIQTTSGDAQLTSTLSEYAGDGRWNDVIDLCEIGIPSFIEKFPNPSIHGGGILAKLYYASKAYNATGQEDKYLACLKILYSLTPFEHAFGTKYQQYIEIGSREYQSLAQSRGIDYLNNFDVTGKIQKKKGGCFIATACYDSYDAPEVMVLREFRDHVLLQNILGKAFVAFYYWTSPSIADFIRHKLFLKKSLRQYIMDPIVSYIKHKRNNMDTNFR